MHRSVCTTYWETTKRRIKDESLIRSTLNSSGMVGLGSRCHTVRTRDREILLAGTEMPWYPPAPDMETHAVPRGSRSSGRCEFCSVTRPINCGGPNTVSLI